MPGADNTENKTQGETPSGEDSKNQTHTYICRKLKKYQRSTPKKTKNTTTKIHIDKTIQTIQKMGKQKCKKMQQTTKKNQGK